MGKLVVSEFVTLDGVVEDPAGDALILTYVSADDGVA
jgi:hypothetical protein